MPDNNRSYISKITTSQGTFYLKDVEARDLIAAISGQIQFNLSTGTNDTPLGVTWDNAGTLITGNMKPATNEGTQANPIWVPVTGYYLVPQTNNAGQDYFAEYIVVTTGGGSYGGYEWEKIGDTEIDFSSLGELAWKDTVTLSKQTASVLRSTTGFSLPATAITFDPSGSWTKDTFVKSYPGSTQKLETVSITGTNGTESVSKVTKSDVTATFTVFGEDTSASKVTTTAKAATMTVFGTNTLASKATAGQPISNLAYRNGSVTDLSRINFPADAPEGSTNVLTSASYDSSTETLTLGQHTVTQNSVLGCNTTTSASITPYTFSNVTVPVVSSNDTVNFDAVASNTSVTVPVVTSNASRTASAVTISNVNVAKVAANATIVATGKTTSSDTNGDTVMIGLGTATTAQALTGVGQANVPNTSITVDTTTTPAATVLTEATDVVVS